MFDICYVIYGRAQYTFFYVIRVSIEIYIFYKLQVSAFPKRLTRQLSSLTLHSNVVDLSNVRDPENEVL